MRQHVYKAINTKLLLFLCCRLVCLRVHPTFTLLHPTETFVSFTSIDGSKHELWPESGDQFYQENLLPNGQFLVTLFYGVYTDFFYIIFVAKNVECKWNWNG